VRRQGRAAASEQLTVTVCDRNSTANRPARRKGRAVSDLACHIAAAPAEIDAGQGRIPRRAGA
jgi:hypothetical protein